MSTTLVSIFTDPKWVEPLLKAQSVCSKAFNFDKSIMIGPSFGDFDCPSNVEFRASDKCGPLTWANYSPWILKNLSSYITTDFCLIYQYDGFIINPDLWSDDFLDYDYIGAIWPNVGQPNRVGNGGFSLRSKKFLDLCTKLPKESGRFNGEDWLACVENYSFMKSNGVNFAPIYEAVKFSVEHPMPEKHYVRGDLSTYKSFGFHDKQNIAAMEVVKNYVC